MGAVWLPSDFKRKRYKRSVELSSEYGLYRQEPLVGCVFSRKEWEEQKAVLCRKLKYDRLFSNLKIEE